MYDISLLQYIYILYICFGGLLEGKQGVIVVPAQRERPPHEKSLQSCGAVRAVKVAVKVAQWPTKHTHHFKGIFHYPHLWKLSFSDLMGY